MKKAAIEKIKTALLREKETLLQKTSQSIEIDFEGDETDKIQANILSRSYQQLSSRNKDKLTQIEKSLTKIKEKSFGSCEECGESIADKRLEVNPYCATCISCAEAREIDLKHRRA